MSLSVDEFTAWSQHHAALFAMHSANDRAVFSAWFTEFSECGYTRAELDEATRICARQTDCNRWDMLQTIHRVIRESRAMRRRQPIVDDRGTCDLCANVGWVIVPHAQFTNDAERLYTRSGCVTMAVTCRCTKGRWLHNEVAARQTERGKVEPLSLDRYEFAVPDWREILAGAAQRAATRRRTESATRTADLDAPLRRVMARISGGVAS